MFKNREHVLGVCFVLVTSLLTFAACLGYTCNRLEERLERVEAKSQRRLERIARLSEQSQTRWYHAYTCADSLKETRRMLVATREHVQSLERVPRDDQFARAVSYACVRRDVVPEQQEAYEFYMRHRIANMACAYWRVRFAQDPHDQYIRDRRFDCLYVDGGL